MLVGPLAGTAVGEPRLSHRRELEMGHRHSVGDTPRARRPPLFDRRLGPGRIGAQYRDCDGARSLHADATHNHRAWTQLGARGMAGNAELFPLPVAAALDGRNGAATLVHQNRWRALVRGGLLLLDRETLPRSA